ncbi:tetratricopeptide repeat protein [Corynebacterium glyciniphilum]|uniref:tetratricopeptide repeat protein n=1 Tax=Corynebacterium glyciniphilum TaxID=1404244 RepID=UPI00264DA98F|nr:tetratricopeptide repeat protein [Corynebacterium glyciniphilum]MDN5683817.1 tetratricopeptide repeat protein [Corynebacterium glyciniphilum]MDN6705742.1 tetratricopeptide repeat protein [Corynebacterium glyciniphilum]
MTTPNNPGHHQQGGPATPNRFAAGAVDLGAVKEAADQRQRAAERSREEAESGVRIARSATITPDTFEQDLVVRSTQVAVILLLGSQRAEGCADMAAEFTRLAEAQDSSGEPVQWVFREVDVDSTPEIAQALQVQAVPTVLALAGGRPLTNFEGVQPAEQIAQFVAAVVRAVDGRLPGLPEQPGAGEDADTAGGSDGSGGDTGPGDNGDPRFDEAASLLDEEDFSGATAVYDSIIADSAAEPETVAEARAARVTAVLLERSASGASDEIDDLLLAGAREEAFDTLIERIRTSEGEDRDAARSRLLEIFSMYDTADPEVIAARTRMASALF